MMCFQTSIIRRITVSDEYGVDSAPYLLIKSTDVKHKLKHRFEWLWSNIDSVLPCPFFPLSFVALMSTSSATYLFF